jgi:hypothetical protein
VVVAVRQRRPTSVNPVNVNILVVEARQAEQAARQWR